MTRRVSSPLSAIAGVIAETLKSARYHSAESSVVGASRLQLLLWAAKLEEIEGRGAKRPEKSLLHANWALRYWTHRAHAPADIDGAVRAVQQETAALYPWEPEPSRETIRRVARRLQADIFRVFQVGGQIDSEPLLTYIKEHSKHGA